ncbi:hypothetical protein ACX0G9_24255 [Flavitalea flava]
MPYAKALYSSLEKYDSGIALQIMVTDSNKKDCPLINYPNIAIFFPEDIFNQKLAQEIYKKYAHLNMDKFRWALKPVFIAYLLNNGFEKVLYTDCDIFFYNDYTFLFDDLDTSNILLTPHWRNSDPLINEMSFFSLFTDGIFNAGFIGANKKGIPALQWWAEACHFKMEARIMEGIYDDQRYLDVLPVRFEDIKVIRNRGCNISAWNEEECKRVLINGVVLINREYPIIFIHFNNMLMQQILKGHDALLLPYFMEFKESLERNGAMLSDFMKNVDYYLNAKSLVRLKWKTMVRTRIKRGLFQLAAKL